MDFEQLFNSCKEQNLRGRYIALYDIEPLLNINGRNENLSVVGESVLGKPIYKYQTGTGKIKILFWSQMHGNESTTTKALFDLFNFLESNSEESVGLLRDFTFCFIPMLNPDGAKLYTRANANGIDLNRDAQDLSQPESRILRAVYEDFKPDYCYNLHDQRTIFGVGDSNKPATVSFLTPSCNESREWNPVRNAAARVINGMNDLLQKLIPGQVGRFDDGFNLQCVGDTFQSLGTPTILFEAGHFQNDYDREQTRKFIFVALLSGFKTIYENVIVDNVFEIYMNIPQNKTSFFDFVYKNVKINYDNSEIITNFAAQYNEELINNTLFFNAFIIKIGDLDDNYGHVEFDAKGRSFNGFENIPILNQKADFYLNDIKVVNGSVISESS
jgi:hypothetical protein